MDVEDVRDVNGYDGGMLVCGVDVIEYIDMCRLGMVMCTNEVVMGTDEW